MFIGNLGMADPRAFIYTFLRQKKVNNTSVGVVLAAVCFTACNGYLNMKYALAQKHDGTAVEYLLMLLGILMFLQGFALNYWSDHILLNLRKGENDTGYYIPHGVPFRAISCPNYLGEITEWTGLCIAYRTYATAAFVVSTCANLVPRARSTHQWYLKKFGDRYPKERTALIPFYF